MALHTAVVFVPCSGVGEPAGACSSRSPAHCTCIGERSFHSLGGASINPSMVKIRKIRYMHVVSTTTSTRSNIHHNVPQNSNILHHHHQPAATFSLLPMPFFFDAVLTCCRTQTCTCTYTSTPTCTCKPQLILCCLLARQPASCTTSSSYPRRSISSHLWLASAHAASAPRVLHATCRLQLLRANGSDQRAARLVGRCREVKTASCSTPRQLPGLRGHSYVAGQDTIHGRPALQLLVRQLSQPPISVS